MNNFYISRIVARNFKGFDSIDIALKKFNIISGGKSERSDLLQIFFFLWYVRDFGFEFTVGQQDWHGSISDKDSTLYLECHFKSDSPIHILESCVPDHCTLTTDAIVYKLSINFSGNRCSVADDRVTADVIFTSPKPEKISGTVTVDMRKIVMKPMLLACKGMSLVEPDDYPLLGNRVITKLISPKWNAFLSGMSAYDFIYPEYLKSQSSKKEHILDHRGTNLSSVLRHMQNNPKMKDMLHNHAKDLIPDFKGISTRSKSDLVEFCLKTGDSGLVPADLVSDENARILSLLACMILPRKFSAIESPEREINPKIFQKISQMMTKTTGYGQMVISTGSPEMLGCAKPGDVLEISRDRDGRPCVSVADYEAIKNLQNILKPGIVKKRALKPPKHTVTDIQVEMSGTPPKKGSNGSIWNGERRQHTMDLRMEMYKKQKKAGNTLPFEGPVSVTLVMAAPLILDVKESGYVGDLDSFVAGVCDAIQPAPYEIIKSNKEFLGPKEIGLKKPLLINNDSQITEIHARKIESEFYGYTLTVRPLQE